MKKIMFCGLVAGMGMFANAAMMDWKYTSTKAEYEAGYEVYVMLGATAKTDWESLDAVKNSNDKLASGAVGEHGSRTKTYYANGAVDDNKLTKTSSYYYLIVNGDQYKASNVYTGTNIYDPAAQESAPDNPVVLDTSALANKSWTSFGGGGGGGGAPEPTSGLLLLVGGAMLALRRKQK